MKPIAKMQSPIIGVDLKSNELIHQLISDQLEEVAVTDGGWSTLYRDASTGEFWERHFPNGHLHGGGERVLRRVTPAYVAETYGAGGI